MLHFALLLECNVFGKRDKHSCSASAIISLSMVSIVEILLTFCVVRPTHISLALAVWAVSLFSSWAATLRFSRLAALPLDDPSRV